LEYSEEEKLDCLVGFTRPGDFAPSIEQGRPFLIWRVDFVYLNWEDWEYQASKAGPTGGGRTHTFGLKNPAAKVKNKAVFRRTGTRLSGGKPTPTNGG